MFASPYRLAWPRTSPFHGEDTGSNPVGDTSIPPTRTWLSQDSNVRQVMSLDTRRLKAELHSTRCKAGYFRLHFRCVIVLKQEIRLLG